MTITVRPITSGRLSRKSSLSPSRSYSATPNDRVGSSGEPLSLLFPRLCSTGLEIGAILLTARLRAQRCSFRERESVACDLAVFHGQRGCGLVGTCHAVGLRPVRIGQRLGLRPRPAASRCPIPPADPSGTGRLRQPSRRLLTRGRLRRENCTLLLLFPRLCSTGPENGSHFPRPCATAQSLQPPHAPAWPMTLPCTTAREAAVLTACGACDSLRLSHPCDTRRTITCDDASRCATNIARIPRPSKGFRSLVQRLLWFA